uniref:EF-hand domain-containing protein n=1 Tax=Echinostoma caproni TaxID=27848 RepID=A0A183B899_9TREM
LFDSVGDGKILAKDIGEVVRALGLNPTESDVSLGFCLGNTVLSWCSDYRMLSIAVIKYFFADLNSC